MKYRIKNLLAFTLAEVLIVLGIIGIICEMTIPTLMQNIQNQTNITLWKKAYSVWSQALMQMQANYTTTIWNSSTIAMRDSFTPYVKTIKVCDNAGDNCWHSGNTIKNLTNTSTMNDYSGQPGIVTADGMKIIFAPDTATEGWIMIDVNGNKGPDTQGKDIFGMRFDTTTWIAIPFTYSEMGTCVPPAAGSAGAAFIGLGCSTYYLSN